jgi:uncharacterized repeat protein (TIGR03803 family)
LTALVAASSSTRSFILLSAVLISSVCATHAQTDKVLYSFAGSPDGAAPYASLVRDKHGDLYGTTTAGGAFGYGTVFKVTKKGKETVLHSFAGGSDGAVPYDSLILDKYGNLYGTTSAGGAFNSGTVFEISSSGTESVLYAFTAGPDGTSPYGGLVFDRHGNLYGAAAGGTLGYGFVFKLSPSHTETVLYSFTGTDGNGPASGLIIDSKGNLYGTTHGGGDWGYGTVFEVTASGSETVLHSFAGDMNDGGYPGYGSLAGDAGGSMYGTTWQGGQADRGTVYEVTGSGYETVLISFIMDNDGYTPNGTLIVDGSGNLFGTTIYSYGNGNCGVAFYLSQPSGTETAYDFGHNPDGCAPYAGMILDAKGNFYGTTSGGGAYGKGTVFEFMP